MSCPLCRGALSGATLNDGGSVVCMQCGPMHYCLDRFVQSRIGPAGCPRCAHARNSTPLGSGSSSSGLATYCPWCQGAIESDPSGNGYRCYKCGPWHQCHQGPSLSAASMCRFCAAVSTRKSRHALPHSNPTFAVSIDKTPRQPAPRTACPTCQRPF